MTPEVACPLGGHAWAARAARGVLVAFAGCAMLAATPAVTAQENSQAVLSRAGCLSCHAKDRKLVGPSYRDVAARYKGRDDAVPYLIGKVRKGGAGVFGPVPMPPNPPARINDADLQSVIEWILRQ